jgi:pimeloyl-ACP methyl ester carboxylesterase
VETIRSKDGAPIAYWQTGIGAPLLLVHGTMADHLTWAPVLAGLERHFSVYTMDRRGRGGSGNAKAYALEREVEDVAAVIDAIGGAVDVVGHSFGGTCSLEATRLTANVRRLMLYEPAMPFGLRYWPAEFSARFQTLLDTGEREQALLLFFRDIVKMPPHEIAGAQALSTWPARIGAVHTIPRELQSLDRYTFDAERFGRMETPTVLLLGGDSPPSMRAIAETLHAALPNSQIVVLPGQQHMAMRTAPEVFVQEVIRFFTGGPQGN